MALDPSIAMGYQPVKVENPINSLAQMLQMQGLQQGNQLNKLKMDEYQSGVERSNSLRSILSGDYAKPEDRQSAMMKGGFLKEATDYAKSNSDIAKTSAETRFKEIETANKRIDLVGSVFGYVMKNPTPENAFAAIDHLASNGAYTPEQANEYKAKVQANPQAVGEMANLAFRGALSAKEQLAKMGDFNAGGSQQFTSTDPVTGEVTKTGSVAITESANNIANNQRIAREGSLNRGNSMEIAKMADARSRDANTIKAGEKKSTDDLTKGSQLASFDTMLSTLDRLSAHPGLTKTVGLRSVLPTIPGGDSANFQAELNTFQSQAFIPMVAQLKGMGALSDAEGKKLTQAVGALDPKMGEKAFRESITRIKADMESAYARVAGKPREGGATGDFSGNPSGKVVDFGSLK